MCAKWNIYSNLAGPGVAARSLPNILASRESNLWISILIIFIQWRRKIYPYTFMHQLPPTSIQFTVHTTVDYTQMFWHSSGNNQIITFVLHDAYPTIFNISTKFQFSGTQFSFWLRLVFCHVFYAIRFFSSHSFALSPPVFLFYLVQLPSKTHFVHTYLFALHLHAIYLELLFIRETANILWFEFNFFFILKLFIYVLSLPDPV